MNQINAVTLGKLIAAHREGDEQKFKTYVDFIAKAYSIGSLVKDHADEKTVAKAFNLSNGNEK